MLVNKDLHINRQIKHFHFQFFGNEFNVRKKDDKQIIQEKIEADKLVALSQIHSNIVHHIDKNTVNESLEGDASITNIPGIALLIQTADCQAIALFDPETRAIGNIHAGWRGLMKEIIPETIEQMQSTFGSDPKNIRAFCSPSLLPCCSEFSNPYNEIEKKWHHHIKEQTPKHIVDLPKIAEEQLKQAGIQEKNMRRMKGCTKCDPNNRFYSYRKKDRDKGMATVIMLHKCN